MNKVTSTAVRPLNDAPKQKDSPLLGLSGAGAKVLAASVLVWALFSMPTILWSQLFPLDMGGIFLIGEHFRSWVHWILSPYNGAGRYFPFYWLYHSAEYEIFGSHVGPYFFVQSLVFLAATLLSCQIIYRLTKRHTYAAILLPLVYVSSPVAENLNTIGKAEPLSYLFLVAIIALFARRYLSNAALNIRDGIGIAVIFTLAIWTKETSVALLGFALTGVALSLGAWRFAKIDWALTSAKRFGALVVWLLFGLAWAKIPYALFAKTNASTNYTAYTITLKLIKENIAFYATQQPDVMFFGLLALLLPFFALKEMITRREARTDDAVRGLIFVFSVCAMSWAYYLALLVWRWAMPYYMLIPAVMFKCCVVYWLYLLAWRLRRKPVLRYSLYSLIALFALAGALCTYYVTISQIEYSRIYTSAIEEYKQIATEKQNLVIESYPFYAEQIINTPNLLSPANPWSGRVKGIADLLDPAALNPELMAILDVTPAQIEQNKKSLPRKGDYLLVFTGSKLATWFLRGVTPYYRPESLLKSEKMYPMHLVSEQTTSSPAIFIHTWTHRPKSATTWLGYKLYQIDGNEPRYLWNGRYPDGWMGARGTLHINPEFSQPVIVRVSAPPFTLPNRVTITKNGRPFQVIELTDTNERAVQLRPSSSGTDVFDFTIERTSTPHMLGLSDDKRELGIRISLDIDGLPGS
ncbi:hypothetical protein OKW45_005928 [Paraburkholderia sp. WSM4175]|uniref:ArnT family glycosyltransferase n=1 Tax=Paraburkholderia sp. WSM4175 TaxID=2991072 RepID=UPI003D1D8840